MKPVLWHHEAVLTSLLTNLAIVLTKLPATSSRRWYILNGSSVLWRLFNVVRTLLRRPPSLGDHNTIEAKNKNQDREFRTHDQFSSKIVRENSMQNGYAKFVWGGGGGGGKQGPLWSM